MQKKFEKRTTHHSQHCNLLNDKRLFVDLSFKRTATHYIKTTINKKMNTNEIATLHRHRECVKGGALSLDQLFATLHLFLVTTLNFFKNISQQAILDSARQTCQTMFCNAAT